MERGKLTMPVMIASLVMGLLVVHGAAMAESFFPDSTMKNSFSRGDSAYLGLTEGADSFRFSDVKAEYILVNVFSIYCSPCQRDAPDFNEMYDKIAELGLDKRIKFIGLAAGNSVREMEFWRQRFNVAFPLISDEDYVLHKMLGNVGTPFFALARVDGPNKLSLVYTREGAFDDKDTFFATILARTSRDVAINE